MFKDPCSNQGVWTFSGRTKPFHLQSFHWQYLKRSYKELITQIRIPHYITIKHANRYTGHLKKNRTHWFPSKIRTVHPIYGRFSENHYSIHAWYIISISLSYLKNCGNASSLKKVGKAGFAKNFHVQCDCLKARQFCFWISPILIEF